MANYYHWFIERFAFIARPLHDLVKKNKKCNWTKRQKKAFRELKEQFIKELVLAVPDLDKKLRVEVDASDYMMGGVLLMEVENGRWKLVAFLSKLLNKIERNYKIHNKEMLAIIKGLEVWRHLLERVQFKFEI